MARSQYIVVGALVVVLCLVGLAAAGSKSDKVKEDTAPPETSDDSASESPEEDEASKKEDSAEPSRWTQVKDFLVSKAKEYVPKYGPKYGPIVGKKVLEAVKGKLPESLQSAADAGIKALDGLIKKNEEKEKAEKENAESEKDKKPDDPVEPAKKPKKDVEAKSGDDEPASGDSSSSEEDDWDESSDDVIIDDGDASSDGRNDKEDPKPKDTDTGDDSSSGDEDEDLPKEIEEAIRKETVSVLQGLKEEVSQLLFVGKGGGRMTVPELDFESVGKVISKILGRGINVRKPMAATIGPYTSVVRFPDDEDELRALFAAGTLQYETRQQGMCRPNFEMFADEHGLKANLKSKIGIPIEPIKELVDIDVSINAHYSHLESSNKLFARCQCSLTAGNIMFYPTGPWQEFACGDAYRMWNELPVLDRQDDFTCDGLMHWFRYYNWYGTHIVRAAVVGGLVEVSAEVDESVLDHDTGVEFVLGLKDKLISAVDVKARVSKTDKNLRSTYNARFFHRVEGGDPKETPIVANSASTMMPQIDRDQFPKWAASIGHNLYALKVEHGNLYEVLLDQRKNQISRPEERVYMSSMEQSNIRSLELYSRFASFLTKANDIIRKNEDAIQEYVNAVDLLLKSSAKYIDPVVHRIIHAYPLHKNICRSNCSWKQAHRLISSRVFEIASDEEASYDTCKSKCINDLAGAVQVEKKFVLESIVPPMVNSTTHREKESHVLKLNHALSGMFTVFQDRYLKLSEDGSLFYYHTKTRDVDGKSTQQPKDSKFPTSIPLRQVIGVSSVSLAIDGEKGFGFSVDTLEKSYLFRVREPAERKSWIETINSWRDHFADGYRDLTKELVESLPQEDVGVGKHFIDEGENPFRCAVRGNKEKVADIFLSTSLPVATVKEMKRRAELMARMRRSNTCVAEPDDEVDVFLM